MMHEFLRMMSMVAI